MNYAYPPIVDVVKVPGDFDAKLSSSSQDNLILVRKLVTPLTKEIAYSATLGKVRRVAGSSTLAVSQVFRDLGLI